MFDTEMKPSNPEALILKVNDKLLRNVTGLERELGMFL